MSKILPGRTENSIKNYFYSSLRRLKSSSVCDVLRRLYIDCSIELNYALAKYDFLREECAKFNPLCQRMCTYLFSEGKKDNSFVQFLVSAIFAEKTIVKSAILSNSDTCE